MKNVLLFLTALTLINCSKDDNDGGTDPIIGTWLSAQDGADLFGDDNDNEMNDVSLTFNYTITFNSNGSLDQTIEFTSTDPNVQSMLPALNSEMGGSSSGTWENSNDSPDFGNTRQTYDITTDGETTRSVINFNASFSEFNLSEDDLTLTFVKQ